MFGNIEIHVNSSDWAKHKHQFDENYNTVVLHVVYEEGQPIYLENGASVPCLELKNIIPERYLTDYHALYHSASNLPCSYDIGKLDPIFWSSYSEKLLIDRLEAKMTRFRTLFLASNNDYKECFYQLLAYSLGLKINAESLLDLTKLVLFCSSKNTAIKEYKLKQSCMVKVDCSGVNILVTMLNSCKRNILF